MTMISEEVVMDRTTEALLNKSDSGVGLTAIPANARSIEKDVDFEPVAEGFKLQYEHQNGRLYQGNSFEWLESLDGFLVISSG